MFPFVGAPAGAADAGELQALFQLVEVPQIILDPARRVRLANAAAERILVVPGVSLRGRRFLELVSPSFQAQASHALDSARELGVPPVPVTLELLAPGGGVVSIELIAIRLPSRAEQAYGLVLRDLRERASFEAMLAERGDQLTRLKKELLETEEIVTREIQEPLRRLSQQASSAAANLEAASSPRVREFVGEASAETKRIHGLIDGLIATVRVETRAGPFWKTSMDRCLARATEELAPALHDAGAVVTHDPLPEIEADGAQMTLLLRGLIANALRLRSTEPPRIHVRAEAREGDQVFSIQDNGSGVPPAQRAHLFTLPAGVEASAAEPEIPIAFAVSRAIVERHGGSIWSESAGVRGMGSAIFFSLPTRHEARARPTPPVTATPPVAPVYDLGELLMANRLRELV
jgi:signal transduction histidine kinase